MQENFVHQERANIIVSSNPCNRRILSGGTPDSHVARPAEKTVCPAGLSEFMT